MRILVIEDELLLAGSIARALTRCGHSLWAQPDAALGLHAALTRRPDLVVLDIRATRGRSWRGQIRQVGSASRVLLLTETPEAGRRFISAPHGPADFLAKPFAMRELVTRVESLGRLMPVATENRCLQVADLCMDVHTQQVTRAGKLLVLSRREFALLHVLMREAGRTFSRPELCERIWLRDHDYGSRTVEMFVSRLRRKVDAGFAQPLVHTVRAFGYVVREPAPH